MDPFEGDLFEFDLQKTFSDLQTDIELIVNFKLQKRLQKLLDLIKLRQKYRIIWEDVKLLFRAFYIGMLLRKLSVQLSTS